MHSSPTSIVLPSSSKTCPRKMICPIMCRILHNFQIHPTIHRLSPHIRCYLTMQRLINKANNPYCLTITRYTPKHTDITTIPRNTPQHAYEPHNAHSPIIPILTSQNLGKFIMSHMFHNIRFPPRPMESHHNAKIYLAMQKFSKKCQDLLQRAPHISMTCRCASKLSLAP